MTTVAAAALASLGSVFCLCPTGDSAGFTARFFFSIAHRCIPVYVDLWQRNMTCARQPTPWSSDPGAVWPHRRANDAPLRAGLTTSPSPSPRSSTGGAS
jgi:hypothetical protein